MIGNAGQNSHRFAHFLRAIAVRRRYIIP